MQYRDFGRLDWKVSVLGFGCMRLPTTGGKSSGGKIDAAEATRMIRHAIDEGVNYLDTAYSYHEGKSEAFLGRALTDGYRERVRLATKSPVWLVKRKRDFDKFLDEQLKRLRTDQIDFYLFHGLNGKSWKEVVVKLNLLDRAEAALDEGKIGHIGFSFHDRFDAFKDIVDGYSGWDFCQIQYNFMDVKNQAGTKGLKYAYSKGLGVVIMEPLLGGKLANPPRPIKRVLSKGTKRRTPADLALQWIWDQREVSVVLSGMSTMAQVNGNLKSASAARPGSLSQRDARLIDRIRDMYLEKKLIPCTQCGYCKPCPNGVDIPVNFMLYNDGYMHDDLATSRRAYNQWLGKKERAASCKQCGKCEERCPQGIDISQLIPMVHSVLGKGASYRTKKS